MRKDNFGRLDNSRAVSSASITRHNHIGIHNHIGAVSTTRVRLLKVLLMTSAVIKRLQIKCRIMIKEHNRNLFQETGRNNCQTSMCLMRMFMITTLYIGTIHPRQF